MATEPAGEAGEPATSEPRSTGGFLMPGEAARILGVSPRTVDRWADAGRLSCFVTLGGHRRFHADSVAKVAQTMGIGPADQPESPPGPIDSFPPNRM